MSSLETGRLLSRLPCHVRANIRDMVIDMHRCEVVKQAINDLWHEMSWYTRHDRWSQMKLHSKPGAGYIIQRFDEIFRESGERAARVAIKEYTRRMVRKRVLAPVSLAGLNAFGFAIGGDGTIEREYRRVIKKRNNLYRAVIGTSRDLQLNENTLPIYED